MNLESGGKMRILPMLLVTFSAAFSQPRLDFDTSVTLRMIGRDSFYIPPIRAFIYYEMQMTASCPGLGSGEFSDSWHMPTRMEKIPSQTDPLVRYIMPCGGFPPGAQAETTFTFDNRQYKVRTDRGDVFMKVTGITKAFRVSLNFSSDPFPAAVRPRRQGKDAAAHSDRTWKDFHGIRVRSPVSPRWHLVDGRSAIRK